MTMKIRIGECLGYHHCSENRQGEINSELNSSYSLLVRFNNAFVYYTTIPEGEVNSGR